jgi:hypothetical protein
MRNIFIPGILASLFILAAGVSAHAQACATVKTMAACVACGKVKYGLERQKAYCSANWKPGRKPISYEQYLREGGR